MGYLFWWTVVVLAIIAVPFALPAIKCRFDPLAASWQVIETAPKDGSPFLAATVCQSMHGTEWWDMSVAVWDAGRGCANDRFNADIDGFTHWRPLPPPPASDGEA